MIALGNRDLTWHPQESVFRGVRARQSVASGRSDQRLSVLTQLVKPTDLYFTANLDCSPTLLGVKGVLRSLVTRDIRVL